MRNPLPATRLVGQAGVSLMEAGAERSGRHATAWGPAEQRFLGMVADDAGRAALVALEEPVAFYEAVDSGAHGG